MTLHGIKRIISIEPQIGAARNALGFATVVFGLLAVISPLSYGASFSVSGDRVNENAGTAEISVSLSAPLTSASRVSIATSRGSATNGSDFYGVFKVLNFAAGETQKRVSVRILDDTAIESDESFNVRIFKPSPGTTLGTRRDQVTINDNDDNTPDPIDPTNDVSLPGLPSVDHASWDKAAVQRVLHNFAYGGLAMDAEIRRWADLAPWVAIKEILTLKEHNLRVAPRRPGDNDNLTQTRGTLENLGKLWASNQANNGTPPIFRENYGIAGWHLENVWFKAALLRGLNPVRQKIGLWETNYHMAVNTDAGVYGPQTVRYYDGIMSAHARGEPYHAVMALAASSSAIAEQYKHKENYWVNGECECNEDFGREFHQLFFGILGTSNHNKHETVTVKNTAKVLTDMTLRWRDDIESFDTAVNFGSEYHHRQALTILDTEFSASATAKTKIEQLAARAIDHPESLSNLPVKIVRGLMDDRLPQWKHGPIRRAWAAMPNKTLLGFIRAYAISTLYHDPRRVKFWTSVDRHALLTGRMSLNNETVHFDIYHPIWGGLTAETTPIFSPVHNVFGAQTGDEAARSANVFQNNYNRMTADFWRFYNPGEAWGGMDWTKDWTQRLPRSTDGTYRVKDIAPWLWNYIIADGLKNFGALERAITYASLAGPESLQWLLDRNNPNRVIRSHEVDNNPEVRDLVRRLGERAIPLTANNRDTREEANGRVGNAVNFIAATPYIFAQEGR